MDANTSDSSQDSLNANPQKQYEKLTQLDFLTLEMMGISLEELRALLDEEELQAYFAFLRRQSSDLDSTGP
ncbi:MAG TPA: hypothetical protein DCG78_06325 [Anaerolineaceae bacterium]|nr:hypothetical protein [Anaerolineaceae bacterium]